VAELWALRSLGFEVYLDGGDGGHSWLREHLVNHYAAAWHQPLSGGEVDAAIATSGLSRWHNYYLEGLGWLVRNAGIDGLYLDGIGQWFGSFVAPNYWYYLRIRVEKDEVLAEASPDGKLWETIHALPRSQFEGDPVAVKIGKMSPGSKGEDYSDPGVPGGSCLIKDLRAYGPKR
jgi:hypothetical protein